MLNVQTELHDEIDEQPHVVEQDCKAEVEVTNNELLARRPREEVLDRFVAVLDPPPAAVPIDPTLKYAINILDSYKDGDDTRTAENLALAGMGFDIIGENHWRPQSRPTGDWEMGFRLFDTRRMFYWDLKDIETDLSRLWPGNNHTGLDVNSVFDAEQDQERKRIEKLINSEQVEIALSRLRSAIESEGTQQFVDSYVGLRPLKSSFQACASAYDDPDATISYEETSFEDFV